MNRNGLCGVLLLALVAGSILTFSTRSHLARVRLFRITGPHVRYLDWREDRASRVQHPLSMLSAPSDWKYFNVMYNPGAGSMSMVSRSTFSAVITETAQFGTETSLSSDEIAAVEANEGFEPGTKVTESLLPGAFSFSCPPWTAQEIDWAPNYLTKSGTCIRREADGRESTVRWTVSVADGVGLSTGAKEIEKYTHHVGSDGKYIIGAAQVATR